MLANFFKLLRNKSKDAGDAILVMVILSLPLLLLLMSFAINVSKNVSERQEYQEMAQKSVETAIKNIDSRGGLTPLAVYEFNEEFDRQLTKNQTYTTGHIDEECLFAEVNGSTRNLPYMEFRLDTGRSVNGLPGASAIVPSEFGDEPEGLENVDFRPKYTVLSVDVYTSATNIFGFFGVEPCQVIKTHVSAITYGADGYY